MTNRKAASSETSPLDRLLSIMAELRNPENGCPWDIAQTFETIAPYTIEEAYEVFDAIARKDMDALKEELGDLLLQVVFHARMAEEMGAFAFADVVAAITGKLIRRHPHVFGPENKSDPNALRDSWEKAKADERKAKASRDSAEPPGALDDIPLALPALSRAEKLGKRAARVGFDWPEIEPVFSKIKEEIEELEKECSTNAEDFAIAGELGDVLFAIVNLARKLNADPEEALRRTNAKFERRFRYIESSLRDLGKTPEQSNLAEMDSLWNAAKASGL